MNANNVEDPDVIQFMDMCDSLDLEQHVDQYT